MHGVSADQIKAWLEGVLQTKKLHVTAENGAFTVECRNVAQQTQVLALNGRVLTSGDILSAKSQEAQLTFDVMRQICRQTLQPRENAHEIKASVSSSTQSKQSQRPAQVAVLEDDSESTGYQETAEPQPPSTAPSVCVAGGMAKKGQKKGKTVAAVAPP